MSEYAVVKTSKLQLKGQKRYVAAQTYAKATIWILDSRKKKKERKERQEKTEEDRIADEHAEDTRSHGE